MGFLNKTSEVDRLMQINILPRFKAAGIHLLVSVLIAGLAALLVFGLWYPWPYRVVSGGQSLFLLVTSVDVVLGPVLTFAVFNLAKGWPHLRRDLAVIAIIQLGGLSYGLYTVYIARPVVIAFEVDRLRVVSHAEVLHDELESAAPGFRKLSLTGPRFVGTRAPRNSDEKFKAVDLAMQGFDVSTRPSYWQPFSGSQEQIMARARPLGELRAHYLPRAGELDGTARSLGRNIEQLRFLPLTAHNSDWVALLDASSAEVVGFAQFDGFF
jgi:hypothetical protein